MKPRAATLSLLIAASLIGLHLEQRRGGLHEAEQGFLDFLVANARSAFARQVPEQSPSVVLVEFREEDKAEFGAWPPAPLDYLMVLKRLQEHEPEVVAITEPLDWAQAEGEFLTQLRSAMVTFPSVVLGFALSSEGGAMTGDAADFAANEMPVLAAVGAGDGEVGTFSAVTRLPVAPLRIAAQTGFSLLQTKVPLPTEAVPVVAGDGSRLVPSLVAQVVTLFQHVPYAAQRLRLGTGARLSLGDELMVPLNADGTMTLASKPQVPRVNALELIAPDVGDETARLVRQALGRHKVVILGTSALAGPQARAVASALAMPQIARAPSAADWGFAAAGCLMSFWLLRCSRMKALVSGFAMLVGGMAVCMVAFQSSLTWWSPWPALVAVTVGMLFCLVWPRRKESGQPAAILPQALP